MSSIMRRRSGLISVIGGLPFQGWGAAPKPWQTEHLEHSATAHRFSRVSGLVQPPTHRADSRIGGTRIRYDPESSARGWRDGQVDRGHASGTYPIGPAPACRQDRGWWPGAAIAWRSPRAGGSSAWRG